MEVKNGKKLDIRKGHVVQCCFCKESIFLDEEEPIHTRTKRKTDVWAHQKCYKDTQQIKTKKNH